jgi:hypothetical protein
MICCGFGVNCRCKTRMHPEEGSPGQQKVYGKMTALLSKVSLEVNPGINNFRMCR